MFKIRCGPESDPLQALRVFVPGLGAEVHQGARPLRTIITFISRAIYST